jgi:hypothetical protein
MIKELETVASIRNLVDRKKYFMSILTRETEKMGTHPVVVGGTAVDFYTNGLFPSRDIDLIGSRKTIGEILEKEFGFSRVGRHWVNERIGIFVEVPSDHLSGDRDKVTVIRFGNLKLYVIGIEDLIIDRLNACVYWKSDTDCKQAEFMFRYYYSRMDLNYLNLRAKNEGHVETLKILQLKISQPRFP